MSDPLPPSVVDELSMAMAETICKTWRSFDTSPRRAQYKARLQVAIGRAIVDELIASTKDEMGEAHE